MLPWTAKPLNDAAKSAHFRQVMNLHAERALLGRQAVVAGWVVGAAGFGCLVASIYGWVTILPLKTVEHRFWFVDHATGIISQPVSLQDAPSQFSEETDRHYLKLYIRAREEWVPEDDRDNDHRVKIMSRADEQERYEAWRKLPTSPLRDVGAGGHVSIANFRFHRSDDGKGPTRVYVAQYDRVVWRGQGKEFAQAWSAKIDFQWKADLPMSPADRDDNPGGMQVVSYSADPDTPDQRRQ